MQVHLPTWGSTADREGINLLKIEDNIDFGARILKNYIRQFGVWEGVKRYNGFIADDLTSEQSAQEYVEKSKALRIPARRCLDNLISSPLDGLHLQILDHSHAALYSR